MIVARRAQPAVVEQLQPLGEPPRDERLAAAGRAGAFVQADRVAVQRLAHVADEQRRPGDALAARERHVLGARHRDEPRAGRQQRRDVDLRRVALVADGPRPGRSSQARAVAAQARGARDGDRGVGRADVLLRRALGGAERARDDVGVRRARDGQADEDRDQQRAARLRMTVRRAIRSAGRQRLIPRSPPAAPRLRGAAPVSSTISPSRRKTTRSAQPASRASCVTSSPEAPASQRARSSRSTASPAWLSSAPVGSSASTSRRGPISARAIATRWRWPPEISSGKRSATSARPSSSSAATACSRHERADSPSSSRGSATFSAAVSAGMRLKSWKT